MKLNQIKIAKANVKILPGDEIPLQEAIASGIVDVYKDGRVYLIKCPYCGSEDFHTESQIDDVEPPIRGVSAVIGVYEKKGPILGCGQCGFPIGTFSGAFMTGNGKKMKPFIKEPFFIKKEEQ